LSRPGIVISTLLKRCVISIESDEIRQRPSWRTFMTRQCAGNIEPALFRKLEDLTNELAYIDQYPERWESQQARLVRRVAVIQMLAHTKTLVIGGRWAMPIELESVQEEAA
jgi:hypothetical protein